MLNYCLLRSSAQLWTLLSFKLWSHQNRYRWNISNHFCFSIEDSSTPKTISKRFFGLNAFCKKGSIAWYWYATVAHFFAGLKIISEARFWWKSHRWSLLIVYGHTRNFSLFQMRPISVYFRSFHNRVKLFESVGFELGLLEYKTNTLTTTSASKVTSLLKIALFYIKAV